MLPLQSQLEGRTSHPFVPLTKAKAHLEKRPRQYQTDAAVYQAYVKTVTGGNLEDGDDEAPEAQATEAPKNVTTFFEPLPWDITSAADMRKVLDFGHRTRLTSFAKELLDLPCMQARVQAPAEMKPEASQRWRKVHAGFHSASEADHLHLKATWLFHMFFSSNITSDLNILQVMFQTFPTYKTGPSETNEFCA